MRSRNEELGLDPYKSEVIGQEVRGAAGVLTVNTGQKKCVKSC